MNENLWSGGFYELAIELGPHSDIRLETALLALWQNDRLDGCFLRRDLEPSDQPHVQPTLFLLEEHGHLLGAATLPNDTKVVCGTFAVREESGSDWLLLYVPMGALSISYEVGAFPFDDGRDSHSWRESLDEWLAALARIVYAVAPFELALIGHQVSGDAYAAEISVDGLPAERWMGYLWQEMHSLVWYPPTIYRASFTVG